MTRPRAMMTAEARAAAKSWVDEHADTPEALLAVLAHTAVFGADQLREMVDANQIALRDEMVTKPIDLGLTGQQIRSHLERAVKIARQVGVKKAEEGAAFILHQYGLGPPSDILLEPVQKANFFEVAPARYQSVFTGETAPPCAGSDAS